MRKLYEIAFQSVFVAEKIVYKVEHKLVRKKYGLKPSGSFNVKTIYAKLLVRKFVLPWKNFLLILTLVEGS